MTLKVLKKLDAPVIETPPPEDEVGATYTGRRTTHRPTLVIIALQDFSYSSEEESEEDESDESEEESQEDVD